MKNYNFYSRGLFERDSWTHSVGKHSIAKDAIAKDAVAKHAVAKHADGIRCFRKFSVQSLLSVLLIAGLAGTFCASVALAQNAVDPTEGFVQSLRSLYSEPDATSDTIGFIEPGEYVRLEHVNALVYRVFKKGDTVAAGYVVYPKLGPTSPLSTSVTPIRATSDEIKGPISQTGPDNATGSGEIQWVHNFANIRLKPNTRSQVVAQLPPGTAVKIGQLSGLWRLIYKQTETVLEPIRALGYVHGSLLKKNKPEPRQQVASMSEAIAEAQQKPKQSTTTPPAQESSRPQRVLSSATDLVNVNAASQRMLESLPRIGPVLAKRIIDYRESKGSFKRVDDLVKVKGIGDKTLERLRPYVTIGQ